MVSATQFPSRRSGVKAPTKSAAGKKAPAAPAKDKMIKQAPVRK